MSPESSWGYTEVAGVEQPKVKVTSNLINRKPHI